MKNTENLHAGHWGRLREKAQDGDITKLSEREVLELTLQFCFGRGDLNDISARLLNKFKSFYKVLNAKKEELLEVEGIGSSVAEKLTLLPKIINYYDISKSKTKEIFVRSTQDCIDISVEFLKNLEHERLYMFILNGSGKLIKDVVLGEGQESCVKVNMHEILFKAGKYNAVNVFFAHNHPSGKSMPSLNDIEFTRQVEKALYFAGIKVVDHVIVARDDSFSFRMKNMLEK